MSESAYGRLDLISALICPFTTAPDPVLHDTAPKASYDAPSYPASVSNDNPPMPGPLRRLIFVLVERTIQIVFAPAENFFKSVKKCA